MARTADPVGPKFDDRSVAHVDMDAFYAAVEVLDDPRLHGKALVVGGSPDGSRGVVCSASYEARKYGVHSAMPAGMAKRLCPHAIFLPGRMGRYEEISHRIRDIFSEFTPLVQPISVDEAFLDLNGFGGFTGAVKVARAVKGAIRDRLDLTASVGLATNKSVAKIASDFRKPDGFVVVPPGREQEFLDPLPVARIWGVGPKAEALLASLGIRTVRQLREFDQTTLEKRFGKWGSQLFRLCRGVDTRDVEGPGEWERKSISAQSTFGVDLSSWEDLEERLLELSQRVSGRARADGLAGKTVTLRARYPDFRTVTRNHTLETPTRSTAVLYRTSTDLLRALIEPGDAFRLLGVGISQLTDRIVIQRSFFDEAGEGIGDRIDRVMDEVEAEAGADALIRARLLAARQRRKKRRERPPGAGDEE
ncbi:MAG: DNA polymerase IV [Planctomycetota bacterium]|jgi:DNA polymerase-4